MRRSALAMLRLHAVKAKPKCTTVYRALKRRRRNRIVVRIRIRIIRIRIKIKQRTSRRSHTELI